MIKEIVKLKMLLIIVQLWRIMLTNVRLVMLLLILMVHIVARMSIIGLPLILLVRHFQK